MPTLSFPFLQKPVSPEKLFWCFALVHLLVWTIVPTLTSPNAPLDVIEGYAWGREWLFGTYKHPPMQAWWLEAFALLTSRASWAHFLASQITIVIAFWAVWQTGLRILGAMPALVGVLLLEGVIYYNFTSPEFNPNVLQLPFWALIGLFYHRAVKNGHLFDWVFLGLWSACGLYSKYSTVLLIGSLVILTLARPESRRRLKSAGPYVAMVTTVVLFVPHILWLLNNHFIPFDYARERMQHPDNVSIVHSMFLAPFFFLISQFLVILPATLLFIGLIEKAPEPPPKLGNFDRTFLATITFGPCFLVLVSAMFFGLNIHDMWAMPFWNFLGIWAIAYFKPALSERSRRRFIYSFTVISIGILFAYIIGTEVYPYITGKPQRIHFPGKTLAKATAGAWHDRFRTPLKYVVGDTWAAGNVAYYTKERPHVLIAGDYSISPWIDPQDFRLQGGIVVWCVQHCGNGAYIQETPKYVTDIPGVEIQPPLSLPRQTGADVPPVVIGWGILPPTAASAEKPALPPLPSSSPAEAH